jgi:hypothetical protein
MPVTINGSAGVTTNSGAVYNSIQSDTAKTATGTSVDFTGIPSWVKRITVMFNGVSTSGTSNLGIQIGSGSVTTSGYTGFTNSFNSSPSGTLYTSSFLASELVAAGSVFSGIATLANITGNTWVFSVAGGDSGNTAVTLGGGNLALGGTLDRIRITTTNGTDTFDAGSINILYE